MTIHWVVYDLGNSFSILEAACLWLEMEPEFNAIEIYPKLRFMLQFIEENADCYSEELSRSDLEMHGIRNIMPVLVPLTKYLSLRVSRQNLIDLAQEKGMKPKFLFPEVRDNPQDIEKLDSRELKTLLRIIRALLNTIGIEPSEGTLNQCLEKIVSGGCSVGTKTIKKYLKKMLEEDPENYT
jgi:hypothetical protein